MFSYHTTILLNTNFCSIGSESPHTKTCLGHTLHAVSSTLSFCSPGQWTLTLCRWGILHVNVHAKNCSEVTYDSWQDQQFGTISLNNDCKQSCQNFSKSLNIPKHRAYFFMTGKVNYLSTSPFWKWTSKALYATNPKLKLT